MARTTKQLSGGGKDKFLRALVANETSIPADAAARLGEDLCAAIADVRVRRETWETIRAAPAVEAPALKTAAPVAALTVPKAASAKSKATAKPTVMQAAPAPAAALVFDPFAFSALALLTKKGAGALSARLAEVATAKDLHALASAQHLSVDAGLTDLSALRAAMLAATQARLAERRAAAS
jgi:hypothetical protein